MIVLDKKFGQLEEILEERMKASGVHLDEANHRFIDEVLEQVFEAEEVLESDVDNTTTSLNRDTDAIIRPEYRALVVEGALARLVADQMYEPLTMTMSTMPNPTFGYERESGVTTTEVAENGAIKSMKIDYGKQTLTAVKHALKFKYSHEALEDALASANLDIRAKAIEEISKDVAKEIDYKLNSVLDAGAVSVVYFPLETPQGYTDEEWLNEINDYWTDVLASVESEDYTPVLALAHPLDVARFAKTKDYKYASHAERSSLQIRNLDGFMGGIPTAKTTNRARGHIVVGERQICGTYGIYKAFHTMPPVYNPDNDNFKIVGRERSAMKVNIGEALGLLLLTQKFTNETLTNKGDNTFSFANWRVDPGDTLSLRDSGAGAITVVESEPSNATECTVDYWNGTITLGGAPSGSVIADEYHAVKKIEPGIHGARKPKSSYTK